MTDLAIVQDRTPVTVPTADGGPRRLVEWAQEASAAHDLAVALCATSFCPSAFQGKAGEATAAILAGSEVGLSPLAALNAYDVIQGRPAPKAITLRALVQSAGHEIWLESASDRQVVMRGRRRGEQNVQTSDWTISRATALGLTNKQQWKQQPQAMLTARATSEIARLVGSDVILGIPYSSEELADESDAVTEPVQRTPRKATAKRAAAPEPPEPDAEPIAGTIEREDDGDQVTRLQLTKIAAQMGDLGITDRDEALAYVADVIERPIESRNELTRAEASRLIEHMARALGEVPDVTE